MICETCNEKILYEVTIFDSMTFCDESCLDAYIDENTIIEDVDE